MDRKKKLKKENRLWETEKTEENGKSKGENT